MTTSLSNSLGCHHNSRFVNCWRGSREERSLGVHTNWGSVAMYNVSSGNLGKESMECIYAYCMCWYRGTWGTNTLRLRGFSTHCSSWATRSLLNHSTVQSNSYSWKPQLPQPSLAVQCKAAVPWEAQRDFLACHDSGAARNPELQHTEKLSPSLVQQYGAKGLGMPLLLGSKSPWTVVQQEALHKTKPNPSLAQHKRASWHSRKAQSLQPVQATVAIFTLHSTASAYLRYQLFPLLTRCANLAFRRQLLPMWGTVPQILWGNCVTCERKALFRIS